jgi:hypothetical protein
LRDYWIEKLLAVELARAAIGQSKR